MEVLTFWLDSHLYGIDTAQVVAIRQDAERIRPVPLAGPGVCGVSLFDGRPMPVVDLAARLGVTANRATRQELIGILEAREQDHVDWLDALQQSLTDQTPFTKARDPHQCAFGRWYDGFRAADPTLAELLERFDEPHRRIHALADRLLEMAAEGRQTQALDELALERSTTLARLRRLFRFTREQLSEQIRPVVLYVSNGSPAPRLGLLLDDINEIVPCRPEHFSSLEAAAPGAGDDRPEVFSGILQIEERQCLVLDPARLMH